MDLKEIKELKDKVYELEGLLELAQMREDKIPELEPLIKLRLRGLCGIEEEEPLSLETVSERTVDEQTVIEQTVSLQEEIMDKATEEAYATPVDSLFDDSEFVPVNSEFVPVKENNPVVEIPAEHKEEPVSNRSNNIHSSYPAQDQLPTSDFSSTSRKPAFCLNDRFRFRRELFANSDAEFSAAMNNIATMENYEEAEEYFLGELGWNHENEDVADFLAIIEQYFEKQ